MGALAGVATRTTTAAAATTAERSLGLAGALIGVGTGGCGTMRRMTVGTLRMALTIAGRLFRALAITLTIALAVARIAALAVLPAI